jgi:sugar/nucleoside kinase (ribokinase family)
VLIVGSLAFDDLEMPTGVFENVLGGAATYSSMAASLLTGVRVVGVVGEDFGEPILADFRRRGIDTEGVERAPGKSFRWRGRYAQDLMSRTTLDTQLNVFANFDPKIPASYRKTPYVLLGNIHPALQISVLDQIDRPKLVAADTMNLWIDTEPELLATMLSRIDLLIVNDEEARQLSGIENIRKAAADIRKRGPSRLIIKRGEFGALLFDDGGIFFVPGYPLEQVLDPTGAGDTFAGGLLGYVARHDDVSSHALRRAMFFGSALASFCVEEIGTKRVASLTKSDLARRIHEFSQMVDHGGGLHFAE